jgi:hypothetical protein
LFHPKGGFFIVFESKVVPREVPVLVYPIWVDNDGDFAFFREERKAPKNTVLGESGEPSRRSDWRRFSGLARNLCGSA